MSWTHLGPNILWTLNLPFGFGKEKDEKKQKLLELAGANLSASVGHQLLRNSNTLAQPGPMKLSHHQHTLES